MVFQSQKTGCVWKTLFANLVTLLLRDVLVPYTFNFSLSFSEDVDLLLVLVLVKMLIYF